MTEYNPQKNSAFETPLEKRKNQKARNDMISHGRPKYQLQNTVLKFQIENRKIERCIAVNTFSSRHT